MKNKTLLKICEDLFEDCENLINTFNGFEFKTSDGGVINAFYQCFYVVGEGDDFLKKYGKNKDPNSCENEEIFADLYQFSNDVTALAFSFGYAMGQMVDPTDPKGSERMLNKGQDVPRTGLN